MAFLEALRSSFTSTSKDAETEAWNLLDALDWGAKRTIKVRLSDGSPPDTIVKTAPKWIESSTFQTISDGRKASWEDLEIPHFPNLILGGNGQRTSGRCTDQVDHWPSSLLRTRSQSRGDDRTRFVRSSHDR